MKDDDQEAVDLLNQMGRLVVPLLTPEREASRHDQLTLAVNRLVQGLPIQPRRRWLQVHARGAVAGLAAAAASIVVLIAARHAIHAPQATRESEVARVISTSGESALWRAGSSSRRLVAEQLIAAGDELRSSLGSGAELALTGAGQARVEVSEATRVRLNQRVADPKAAHEDSLDLERGMVTLQVSKLPPGLGLSVQTPDARVTVHGTRFSVRVTPRAPAGTVTFVSVSEGRVAVACRGNEVLLGPGEHWSSQERAPVSPPLLDPSAGHQSQSSDPAATFGETTLPAAGARSERHELQVSSAANESTLAEENRLYRQAAAHAFSGDSMRALASLSRLIRDYPRSPLAQNARVDRFRLLQETGNASAAAHEARRYLSEYPNGFARTEARRLALQGLEDAK